MTTYDTAQKPKRRPAEPAIQKTSQGQAGARSPQRGANATGLPDRLKDGIESLSGMSLDNVRVQYNSHMPAQLSAHAYAQGRTIHLGPGQERHLPHEAWHVVQQAQGRVQPTMRLPGAVAINDDSRLEQEADEMGQRALQRKAGAPASGLLMDAGMPASTIQCHFKDEAEALQYFRDHWVEGKDNEALLKDVLPIAEEKKWGFLVRYISLSQSGNMELAAERAPSGANDSSSSEAKSNDDEQQIASAPVRLQDLPLKDVLTKMLVASGKQTNMDEARKIVLAAHEPESGTFVADQVKYQQMLLDIGLGKADIMNFNRSAGFEYEFSQFYESGKPEQLGGEAELLRSHVHLAQSQPSGAMFNLPFSLETDSRNALEMVTPPFLFLISSETATILKRTHDKYEQAIHLLKAWLDEPANTLLNQAANRSQFEKLGFGEKWSWIYTGALQLCANSTGGKHATSLGQINVSLDPDEIVTLTSAMVKSGDAAGDGQFHALRSTDPTSPTEELFMKIYDELKPHARGELGGILAFYAKSASNILGIPSILYRNVLGKRPNDGNYATAVKETLGLWVKDFPYLVIADYFDGKPIASRKNFIATLTYSAPAVLELIRNAVESNIEILRADHVKEITAYYAPENRQANLGQIRAKMTLDQIPLQEANTQIAARVRGWAVEGQNKITEVAQAFTKVEATFLAMAMSEYQKMAELVVDGVAGIPAERPAATRRDDAESFGGGHGVRKETYPAQLPGSRKLRVAEIRSSRDLFELELKLHENPGSKR